MHKDVKGLFSEFDGYCEALNRNGCISYPVTISWNTAGPHHGRPVVLIMGQEREAGDLPAGELQVPANILQQLRERGYDAQSLSVEDLKGYWREARLLEVKGHWHPDARLVQY